MKLKLFLSVLLVASSMLAKERYINGQIRHCVTQCYGKMKDKHQLGDLSKDFIHVHTCIEKGDRGCEQNILMHTVKELQTHGYLKRVQESAFTKQLNK